MNAFGAESLDLFSESCTVLDTGQEVLGVIVVILAEID
jgi:hypothetical protein